MTYKPLHCTQWTRVNRLQYTMPVPIDAGDTFPSRIAPSQENHAVSPDLRNSINDFLGKSFPPFIRVAIGLVCADRQACVEHENTAVSPGR